MYRQHSLFCRRNGRTDAKKKFDAVVIGDSNTYPADGYVSRLGITAANGGFWNTCLARTGGVEGSFAAVHIADAVIANNFNELIKIAPNNDFKSTSYALNAANTRAAGIIIVAYGANDFNKNVPLGSIDPNDQNIDTFKGAIRYVINRLQTELPNTKLLFITPGWRTDKSESIASFTNTLGLRLEDYVNAIVSICGKSGVPVVDFYHDGGIGDDNAALYLQSDGLHFTNAGQEKLAGMIRAAMAEMEG